jgi:hypothetical protein
LNTGPDARHDGVASTADDVERVWWELKRSIGHAAWTGIDDLADTVRTGTCSSNPAASPAA